MNTNIDMEQLAQDADNIFHQGFACSESVIYAIRKNFEIDLSDDAAASAELWQEVRCASATSLAGGRREIREISVASH